MRAKTMRRLALGLSLVLAGPASANGFYAGVGASNNELTPESADSFDTATGYQAFAGYDFGSVFGTDLLGLRLEGGYFSSGDFENDTGTSTQAAAEGIWASGVLDFNVTESFAIYGRAGFDGGDDDGPLAGVGAALDIGSSLRLSGELVSRENIDTVQLNVSFGF